MSSDKCQKVLEESCTSTFTCQNGKAKGITEVRFYGCKALHII